MHKKFLTHIEECNIVADQVMDDARFLQGLALGLEQAGGEDRGQFLARHVVEVGTLLNPESQKDFMVRRSISRAHTYYRLRHKHIKVLGIIPNSAKSQLNLLQTIYIINITLIYHSHPLQVSKGTTCNVSISE